MSARHAVLAAVLAVSLAASCSSDGGGAGTQTDGTAEPSSSAEPSTPLRTGTQTPTTSPVAGPVTPAGADEIVTGLDAPWAIAFIDDSTALVSQRDADTIVQVGDSGRLTELRTVTARA